MVHSYSPHNFISSTSCVTEDWVKRLFPLVPHEEHEAPTFLVDDCRDIPCDVTSTHVLIPKDFEEYLSIRDIDENMTFESTKRADYIFKELIYKYIIEMEDQGCTKLSCVSREWFDMHSLEERPHKMPVWNEDSSFE